MARSIKDAFAGGKAFIAFITAGDPNLAATEEYILEMERAGADLIEIGIPFSDPIAEGVVIQEADLRALKSGTTTDKIFDMVGRLRQKTDMPLVFMGYLNPVFHYRTRRRRDLNDRADLGVPDPGDRVRGAGLFVCRLVHGRHRRALRDQNRPGLYFDSDPEGDGHSGGSRIRHQHSGAGGKNCCNLRWSNCRQRNRADRGSIWD